MADVLTDTDGAAQSVEGAGAVSSGVETFQAAFGGDLAEFGASATGLALDGLSTVADPFGALVNAGLGWAIEHFGPLKELFDMVTGDADAIKRTVGRWNGVAGQLTSVEGQAREQLARDLSEWVGDARKAFDGSVQAVDASILATADRAAKMAEGVGGLGNLLSVVRALLRDVISEIAAWAIGALVGGAIGSVFTFGAAGAAAITALGVKIATKVAEWGPKFARLASAISRMARWFAKFADEMAQMRSLTRTGRRLPDTPGGSATSSATRSGADQADNAADAGRGWSDRINARSNQDQNVTRVDSSGEATRTTQRDGYYQANERAAWSRDGREHNLNQAYRDTFTPENGWTPADRHRAWLNADDAGPVRQGAQWLDGNPAAEWAAKGAVETGKSVAKDDYSQENIDEDERKSWLEK